MDFGYAITPFIAWIFAGGTKFLVNSVRARRLAFDLIGYGGLPSNHSAIVSSIAALIAFREGMGHPAFGVSIALAFIVMLDASSLRRQVGKHAQLLNQITEGAQPSGLLRERIGHTRTELLAGVAIGLLVAFVASKTLFS